MSEGELQFHTDISRSWSWVRAWLFGALGILVFVILIYFFPILPITAEINPTYVEILVTLTGIVYAMISLFIFRPSYILLRHRLMMLYSESTISLGIVGLVSYNMAVGRVPGPGGERDIILFIFFIFIKLSYTLAFLIFAALSYKDKMDRAKFAKKGGSNYE